MAYISYIEVSVDLNKKERFMVSDRIKNHLNSIVKKTGLDNRSTEIIFQGFMEKLQCFDNLVDKNSLKETSFFSEDNLNGAIIITYSGSLLSLGPVENGVRKVEYASIGARKDVPEIASEDFSKLDGHINQDSPVKFICGPIRQSSSVYKMAIVDPSLPFKTQEELLNNITRVLLEDFVEVNNTVIG